MKDLEILYNEDEDEDIDDLLDKLSVPLGGSPLVIGLTIANSAMPMSQSPYPESESTDNNISRTWTGILSFYG